jgi:hypothetical protein
MLILPRRYRGGHRAPRLSSGPLVVLLACSATASRTASAAGVALTLAGAR